MASYITEHEAQVRLIIFAVVLVVMAVAESLFPKKKRQLKRAERWFTNLSLVVINSLVSRFLLPIMAVGTAAFAQSQNWGLLNLVIWPTWVELILSLIVLDMLIYWQHVASHHIPFLWALHKVHHADPEIDVTTGNRFHPIEILLSMGYKMFCILLLGPPVVAVIIFEIVLNGCAMFNHSNVRIHRRVDGFLRLFIVTPDMHRVHHSVYREETNSNYGFSWSIWDRIFRSYIPQPRDGHDDMVIGLPEYQSKGPTRIIWSLLLPGKAIKKLETWL